VTDEEWEERRKRVIMAAFQTGRPVFADADGVMRYADGDREPLADEVGVAQEPQATTRIYTPAMRASRAAFIASIVAAIANVIAGLWHPWYFVAAAGMTYSAVVWRSIHRGQRALYGAKR
jgi:hypothetical protein